MKTALSLIPHFYHAALYATRFKPWAKGPHLPELTVVKSDPIPLKAVIFNRYSLVATQP